MVPKVLTVKLQSRHQKFIVCAPVKVRPEMSVREPKIRTAVERVKVNDVVNVAPVQSIALPSLGISAVTVRDVVNAQLSETSSCGNGTLEVQFAAVDHDPPEVLVQVCDAGVVNVILVFPQQSHDSHVIADKSQDAAPAAVMLRKSAYVIETAAAVNVLGVAVALGLESTKIRLIALLPLIVNVPLIV